MVRRKAGAAPRLKPEADPGFSGRLPETECLTGRASGLMLSLAYRRFEGRDAASCSSILVSNYSILGPARCGIKGSRRFAAFLMDYTAGSIPAIAEERNYRVAELSGSEPAGVVGVGGFISKDGRVMVVDVSVRPSLQGEGVGTFLIVRLLEEIRSLPSVRMVCLEASRTAIGMYERLGFRSSILHPAPDEKAPVPMKMLL